jgi:hypothetical protein
VWVCGTGGGRFDLYSGRRYLADLERNVLDAVRCHFDEDERPRMVRLHFTREEVIAV